MKEGFFMAPFSKTWKKTSTAVCLAALLCAAMSACSKDTNSQSIPQDPVSSSSGSSSSSQSSSTPDIPSSSYSDSSAESSSQEQSSGSSSQKDSQAMGNEFSQLASLDATRQDWGHGGPRNADDNRPTSPETFQKKYGQYDADFIAPKDKKFYLTFDEGYENGYTAQILDVLKEKQASAVFFVTYDYVQRNPDLVQRMIDEGHTVGNHSFTHPCMAQIPLSQAKEEVMKLHDYVKENFGGYEMSLFRFPMGQYSEQCLALLQSLGYRSVFWSFAYQDWDPDNQMEPSKALEKVTGDIHEGAIYLLHAVSKTNTEILGDVIDAVRAKGLTICSYDL